MLAARGKTRQEKKKNDVVHRLSVLSRSVGAWRGANGDHVGSFGFFVVVAAARTRDVSPTTKQSGPRCFFEWSTL